MLDIESTVLSPDDIELITNNLVGGVILFSRNFESADQVLSLTNAIRSANPSIIIAVDQEGGRVQRFTDGFSKLPPMATLGNYYQIMPDDAISYSRDLGELMALEVQSVGCDISFAPVLDLGHQSSLVIGDRAFSTSIEEITQLGKAFIEGMRDGGMGATGKHFPGHGSVIADSHVSIPYDERSIKEIKNKDIRAFSQLSSELLAVMPAHIIYSQVDEKPAGFSSIWMQQILREELGFDGVIFSDDLSMKGAEAVGGFRQRAKLALRAGCDMILVCNDNEAAKQVIDELDCYSQPIECHNRLEKLQMKKPATGLDSLKQTIRWQHLSARLEQFTQISLG